VKRLAVRASRKASFAAATMGAHHCWDPHTGRMTVAVSRYARILSTTSTAKFNGS